MANSRWTYTSLAEGADETPPNFSPPFTSEYEQRAAWSTRLSKWWREKVLGQTAPRPQSGYLTLIPLSDSRLKPQRTTLLVALLVLLGVSAALATFLLVPRGVSVGEINIHSDHMSFNVSKGTYQLDLIAHIPVFNPNYLQAKIEGDLKVSYYDTEAGLKQIEAQSVPARSWPSVIKVTMDASNVPTRYALTVLSQCNLFPRRLVFFLHGTIQADYLGQHQVLSPIDTYFLIDCVKGASTPKAGSNTTDDLYIPVLRSPSADDMDTSMSSASSLQLATTDAH